MRFLAKHKCDEVQGFYFGEPAAPAEYAQLLAKTRKRARRG
jgi:EAL domain-containing protein (putative c-di-GMP-specific phosphodiesterase class I)